MLENLPPRLDLCARKGATLGPIEATLGGVDLTLYDITASHPVVVQVQSATVLRLTWSAALVDTLPFTTIVGHQRGNTRYWIDGKLKTDPTVVVPLLAGVINVVDYGGADA